jgi:hypothetical protein
LIQLNAFALFCGWERTISIPAEDFEIEYLIQLETNNVDNNRVHGS